VRWPPPPTPTALARALSDWLDEREKSGTWRPNVIKFSQNLLGDIRPRAMTRDIDWGIPVPGWEDQPNKRLYVWFDAVIGYLSASVEWARRRAAAGEGSAEDWRRWWNDPDALSYYFMGKDNIVFHSQIWPAELLAYNGEGSHGGEPGSLGALNLPTQVVASEFLTMEGKKFSSSKNVVIYVRDVLSRYQPDALRYFISIAGPENSDADFTWAEFVRRNNSELVAGWGNLVNRTAAMIAKNFGEIPAPGGLEPVDEELLAAVRGGFDAVGDHIANHRQRAALAELEWARTQSRTSSTSTSAWSVCGNMSNRRERTTRSEGRCSRSAAAGRLAVGEELAVGDGRAVGDRLAVGEGLAVVGEGDGEIDAVGVGLIVVGATGGVGFTSVEGDTVGAPGAPGAGFWGVFTFALYVS